jgi:hypothetical protein
MDQLMEKEREEGGREERETASICSRALEICPNPNFFGNCTQEEEDR